VSDPQKRDIDWFSEWEEIEEQDREPEIVGQEDAESRLWVVKRLRSDLAEIKAHADIERARIATWETSEASKVSRQMDWLEKGLRAFLMGTGKVTMNLIGGKLKYRKGREKVEIEDEQQFVSDYNSGGLEDQGFIRETIKHAPDKKAILAHIKATGEVPEGVELVYGEDSFSMDTE
tara:strand:- start:13363 stop:13890 length:528 start_codon:yes stop_codon:yes gene_type:complete